MDDSITSSSPPPPACRAPILPYEPSALAARPFRRDVTGVPMSFFWGTMAAGTPSMVTALIRLSPPAGPADFGICHTVVIPLMLGLVGMTVLLFTQIVIARRRGGVFYRRPDRHYLLAGVLHGLCLAAGSTLSAWAMSFDAPMATIGNVASILLLFVVPLVAPFFLIGRTTVAGSGVPRLSRPLDSSRPVDQEEWPNDWDEK